jgi:hypothetical protein
VSMSLLMPLWLLLLLPLAYPANGATYDFDVLTNGEVVGRVYKANASPVGSPWMWTLAFWYHEGRGPTHGYAATREAAMAAFAKSCRLSDLRITALICGEVAGRDTIQSGGSVVCKPTNICSF